jgi:hypothetical protein
MITVGAPKGSPTVSMIARICSPAELRYSANRDWIRSRSAFTADGRPFQVRDEAPARGSVVHGSSEIFDAVSECVIAMPMRHQPVEF